MSAKQLVEKVIRAYNAHDTEALAALLHEDCTYRELSSAGRTVQGRHDAAAAMLQWQASWPDLAARLDRVSDTDGVITCELTWIGHQTEKLILPDGTIIPPNGAEAVVPACQILSVRDGLIREIRHYFDPLGFLGRVEQPEGLASATEMVRTWGMFN